jgi:hypothetical protein
MSYDLGMRQEVELATDFDFYFIQSFIKSTA